MDEEIEVGRIEEEKFPFDLLVNLLICICLKEIMGRGEFLIYFVITFLYYDIVYIRGGKVSEVNLRYSFRYRFDIGSCEGLIKYAGG